MNKIISLLIKQYKIIIIIIISLIIEAYFTLALPAYTAKHLDDINRHFDSLNFIRTYSYCH